jgi:2-methylaconitate cis-trans-isomerase PrpF
MNVEHPTGIVEVVSQFESEATVKFAGVSRTGKRLMKGVVYW